MNEIVNDSEKEQVYEKMLLQSENNFCFDCGNKSPEWISIYLGVIINIKSIYFID